MVGMSMIACFASTMLKAAISLLHGLYVIMITGYIVLRQLRYSIEGLLLIA